MKILRVYLTVLILILLNGCCYKKKCEGFDGQSTITLHNFSRDDTDSIAMEVFEIGTNGKTRIDSSFRQASDFSNTDSTFTLHLSRGLRHNYSYTITFCSKNMGQVYTISDFKTSTEQCDNCMIKSQNPDFELLRTYTLNGQIQYSATLHIKK